MRSSACARSRRRRCRTGPKAGRDSACVRPAIGLPWLGGVALRRAAARELARGEAVARAAMGGAGGEAARGGPVGGAAMGKRVRSAMRLARSRRRRRRRRSGAIVAPRMSLHECARLLADARGVVGVDTGLTHLSAALDCPTVALFAATPAWRYGPYWTPRALSLGADGVVAVGRRGLRRSRSAWARWRASPPRGGGGHGRGHGRGHGGDAAAAPKPGSPGEPRALFAGLVARHAAGGRSTCCGARVASRSIGRTGRNAGASSRHAWTRLRWCGCTRCRSARPARRSRWSPRCSRAIRRSGSCSRT